VSDLVNVTISCSKISDCGSEMQQFLDMVLKYLSNFCKLYESVLSLLSEGELFFLEYDNPRIIWDRKRRLIFTYSSHIAKLYEKYLQDKTGLIIPSIFQEWFLWREGQSQCNQIIWKNIWEKTLHSHGMTYNTHLGHLNEQKSFS
jgi:hypothetical protein